MATSRKTWFIIIDVLVLAIIIGSVIYWLVNRNQPETVAEVITTTVPTATVIPDALNLRSGPGMDYAVIKILRKGDTLSITGEVQRGWQPVEHNGNKGYVSLELIKLNR
jgi:uncharacterized protein YgiM (DUF1202 family)